MNFNVTLHNKVVGKLSPNVTRDGLKSKEKKVKKHDMDVSRGRAKFSGVEGGRDPFLPSPHGGRPCTEEEKTLKHLYSVFHGFRSLLANRLYWVTFLNRASKTMVGRCSQV